MLRPLGSLEHFCWLLDHGPGSQVVFAAELDGTASPLAWRAAFDALQRRHPMLRVRVPATPLGFPYLEAAHDQPVPLRHASDAVWSNDGIAPEWLDAAIALELGQKIDTDTAPLMRAVIASGHEQSVLLMTCSHEVCDGISLSYCLRDLLEALSGKPLDALPMPPSLNQLQGEPNATPPTTRISLDVARSATCSLPIVRRLKLSRELTGQIAQRAREEDVTVHGALFSALLKSALSAKPAWRNKPLKLVSAVDLRRQFGIDDDCGCFTASAKATLEAGFDGPFWAVARDIMRMLNVPDVIASTQNATRDMTKLLANGLDANAVIELRRTAMQRDITLSNLGPLRFESKTGPLQLTGLWGPSMPIGPDDDPDSQVVGATTVNGCVHLMLTSLMPLPSLLETAHAVLREACAS